MPDPSWNLYNGLAVGMNTFNYGGVDVVEDGLTCRRLINTGYFGSTGISWTNNITVEFYAKFVPSPGVYTTGYCDWRCYLRDSNKLGTYGLGVVKGSQERDPEITTWVAPNSTSTQFATTDVMSNTWNMYRLVIQGGYLYSFINGCYYMKSTYGTTVTNYTANTVAFSATYASPVTSAVYINTVKASSTPKEPDNKCGWNIGGENIAGHFAQRAYRASSGDGNRMPVEPVLYYRTGRPVGSVPFGVELVTPGHQLTSRVRVWTGAGERSLTRYPTF